MAILALVALIIILGSMAFLWAVESFDLERWEVIRMADKARQKARKSRLN